MEYFLGIDIGTTSVKAVAFYRDGKTVLESSVSYPIYHPFPEWSEQDPEIIYAALVKTVEYILQELFPDIPVLCCFSSAMHSLIAVDRTGRAISPSIIWADNRATSYASRIHAEHQAEEFYRRTGLPVHAMSPFCKLQWMKDNQSEIFSKAYKFVGIKEFVFNKLFGIYAADASVAAATGLMNAETHQWDPWILEQIGVSADKLSEIVEIDKIFYSPDAFPLLKTIPFVVGGSDGAMANIGASDEPGGLIITIGTSSAARLIINEPYFDPYMRTFCYYLQKGQWLLGGASNNGGIVMQWLQEEFFQSEKTMSEFLKPASTVSPGADGLIFLPYLLGERAPIWDADAKGVLFGVHINHGRAQMIRASLEGVIYCIRAVSQALLEKTDIHKIFATGGFARNDLWVQMMADVFNLPVLVCGTVENSAWGAVKTGMLALGIPVIAEVLINKTYHPDPRAHEVYAPGFKKFQRLYELLKSEFR